MTPRESYSAVVARIPQLEAELVELSAEADDAEHALAELRARDPALDLIERDNRRWTRVFRVGMVLVVLTILTILYKAMGTR